MTNRTSFIIGLLIPLHLNISVTFSLIILVHENNIFGVSGWHSLLHKNERSGKTKLFLSLFIRNSFVAVYFRCTVKIIKMKNHYL